MSATEPPLVLVAEDDPDILELIVACLESIGCATVQARDGATALALAGARRPRLAVLDIRMPRLDGLQLTRLLKADPATGSIAVLVLTASVAAVRPEEVRSTGADGYLAKPFGAAQLRDAVLSLLDAQ